MQSGLAELVSVSSYKIILNRLCCLQYQATFSGLGVNVHAAMRETATECLSSARLTLICIASIDRRKRTQTFKNYLHSEAIELIVF